MSQRDHPPGAGSDRGVFLNGRVDEEARHRPCLSNREIRALAETEASGKRWQRCRRRPLRNLSVAKRVELAAGSCCAFVGWSCDRANSAPRAFAVARSERMPPKRDRESRHLVRDRSTLRWRSLPPAASPDQDRNRDSAERRHAPGSPTERGQDQGHLGVGGVLPVRGLIRLDRRPLDP